MGRSGRGRGGGRQQMGRGHADLGKKLNSFRLVSVKGNPVGLPVIFFNALVFSFLSLFLSSRLLWSIYLPTVVMSLVGYDLVGDKIIYVHAVLHLISGYCACLLLPWILQNVGFVYLFTSMYFRFFPMHKRSSRIFPLSSKPRILGHRIGCGEGIENAVGTYQLVKDAVWGIQLDVLETKNKQLVLFHDELLENNLKRLTGTSGEVKDFNMEDLPKFSDNVKVFGMCDAGQELFDGKERSIDSFGTLLKTIEADERAPFLMVEMWDASESLVKQTHELLEKSGHLNNLVWGNPKNEKIAKICQQTAPKTPRVATALEWTYIRLLHYFYLLPFVTLRENLIFNIPLFTSRFRNMISKLFQDSRCHWPLMTFIYPTLEWFFTSHSLIDHLQRRNVPVFVFVCNCEEDFKLARQFKPDAIMTDYPHRLQNYLGSETASELETKKAA